MEFDILDMVVSQSDRFAEAVPDFAALGFVYGWVYVLSMVTAVITFLFVVFRRESGAVSGSLIVQWLAVWAIPMIVSSAIEAFGGDEAVEGAMLLVSNLL